jgi:hypothetical protein
MFEEMQRILRLCSASTYEYYNSSLRRISFLVDQSCANRSRRICVCPSVALGGHHRLVLLLLVVCCYNKSIVFVVDY